MKSIAVLFVLVAGVASYTYPVGSTRRKIINSRYGNTRHRFVEEIPKLTKIVETRAPVFRNAVRITENRPLRLESSYGQQNRFLDIPAAPVRIVERPKTTLRVLKEHVPITKFNHVIDPEASEYSYSFEGANGINSQESGFLKGVPASRQENSYGSEDDSNYGYGSVTRVDDVVHAKSGVTSWCSPEGLLFTLAYTADENGYHPEITKGSCNPSDDSY